MKFPIPGWQWRRHLFAADIGHDKADFAGDTVLVEDIAFVPQADSATPKPEMAWLPLAFAMVAARFEQEQRTANRYWNHPAWKPHT